MSARFEVAVVGAGVIGLSVGFELARRGRSVVVLERGEPGAGASGVAAGMLAPVSEAEVQEPDEIVFALDSLRRYRSFVSAIEAAGGEVCGYRDEGTLWVAARRDDREQLEHLAETLRQKDLHCEPLTADRLLELEPHLSARVVSGLRVPSDHQVDPRRLLGALLRAIESMGGDVRPGHEVREVSTRAGRAAAVAGRGPDGREFEIEADDVVLAAGPWHDHAPRSPLPALGVRPVKGQILRLRGEPLVRHVIRTPDVYLVPRSDGELVVGATMEEMGFDRAATAGAVLDLLRHAWLALPGIYDLELARVDVGLRPAVDDQMPVIGPTPVPGLWLAAGHHRHGILLAAATAAYLAGAIVGDGLPPELGPFLPRRLWSEEDDS